MIFQENWHVSFMTLLPSLTDIASSDTEMVKFKCSALMTATIWSVGRARIPSATSVNPRAFSLHGVLEPVILVLSLMLELQYLFFTQPLK